MPTGLCLPSTGMTSPSGIARIVRVYQRIEFAVRAKFPGKPRLDLIAGNTSCHGVQLGAQKAGTGSSGNDFLEPRLFVWRRIGCHGSSRKRPRPRSDRTVIYRVHFYRLSLPVLSRKYVKGIVNLVPRPPVTALDNTQRVDPQVASGEESSEVDDIAEQLWQCIWGYPCRCELTVGFSSEFVGHLSGFTLTMA